jgi:hypothetical protein
VFAAIYAAEVISAGRVPTVAKESIQDATEAASKLEGMARTDLLNDAVASFDLAARWGLAVCLAALLAATAFTAVGLRSRVPER